MADLAMSRIVTDGQLRVLADMMTPRLQAVLSAFGLQPVGPAEAFVHTDDAHFNELLYVRIPFRRREGL